MTQFDPIAEYIIESQRAQTNTQADAKPERETRLRPHETGRKARQMNVTFPTGAWTEAIREIARLRGLRPADFVVWCVSYAIAQIHDNTVTAPSGQGRKQHHTACEWLDLPWEPEGKVTEPQERRFQASEGHKVG